MRETKKLHSRDCKVVSYFIKSAGEVEANDCERGIGKGGKGTVVEDCSGGVDDRGGVRVCVLVVGDDMG